jgi:hypothetical protein
VTLTASERTQLLLRARRAAAAALGIPSREPDLPEPEGPLAEPGMCFVTWKRDGELRGCIGSVAPVRALWADVHANAVHALLEDPRFPPATPDELAGLRIEISVLTPFRPVADPLASVKVGRHGLLVERGAQRGLLLPQVPVEWEWDVPTFLLQACRKAGLPPDAWSDPRTRVSTFTAEVFGEEDARTGG